MAGPNVDIVVKKHLQIAQLKLIYKGPLIEDALVNDVSDLTSIDIRYNYDHKIVWVKSQECYYYLIDGDGSQLIHWKKFAPDSVIAPYELNSEYVTNDIVLFNYILYVAEQNVNINESPLNTPAKWKAITSEIKTVRYVFDSVDSLIFYTDIKNPIFQCFIGNLPKDGNDDYEIDSSDGMILIESPEEIEAEIKRRSDLPDNSLGRAYEIKFIEEDELIELSGIINIK